MAQRDPKTGRFLPKAKTSKPAKGPKSKPAPKAKKSKKQDDLEIGVKIERVLETPMEIFIKKDLTGKAKHILPGNSVSIEKTEVIGPTGSNLVRIKRANCDRTYYAPEENI